MKRTGSSRYLSDDCFALLALFLLCGLRLAPTLITHKLYGPFQDNVFIYGPIFAEISRISLAGAVPYYLPSFGTGFPLFQSPHCSPFYPFYLFGVVDYGGPIQSLYTLNYLTVFHRVILAVNFFVMLRSSRVAPWAAFAGASIGVLAFNTEVYSSWITITASYTWLPLLIAGGVLIVREKYFLGTLLLGGSAGLLALASASQAIAHALLFCLVFFSAAAVWLWKVSGLKRVIAFSSTLLCAAAIAFGIAAVSVIPVSLGIGGMIRHLGIGHVLGHQKIPWEKFNLYQLTIKDVPAIFLHSGFLDIVGSPYVGPLGVVGVISALFFFPRLSALQRLLVGTAGAIGLYALLSAFGTTFGFSYINYHLPLIDNIREAGRHLVLFVVAVVFLSGIGFDQFRRNRDRKDSSSQVNARLPRIFFLLLSIFLLIFSWELLHQWNVIWGRACVLLLAPAITIVARVCRSRAEAYLVISAIFVSVAALLSPVNSVSFENGDYFKADNPQHLAILSALQQRIGVGEWRIDFADRKTTPFTWGMNASYFGFNSFYNRLTPQPYDQFRFSLMRNPFNLREMMGGRYVLCAPTEKPVDARARLIAQISDYTLFENPSYMDRLTLLHALAGTYKDEGDFVALAARGFNFNQRAFCQVEDLARLKPFLATETTSREMGGETLYQKTKTVNKVSVVVHATRPGLLILNEWFTDSWKARVNGIAQPTVRANLWQVGLPVNKGNSLVEFAYQPPLSRALLILNRMTWILVGLALIARFLYRYLNVAERLGSSRPHIPAG